MILNFLKGFGVDQKRKPTNFEEKIKKGVKLHTIRWDEQNKWSRGRKIHFSTGARTGNYNCFKEGECTGTQAIAIHNREVFISGRSLLEDEIEDLSINDGFDSITDFWAWFDQYTPFDGKIIHWTGLRYKQD